MVSLQDCRLPGNTGSISCMQEVEKGDQIRDIVVEAMALLSGKRGSICCRQADALADWESNSARVQFSPRHHTGKMLPVAACSSLQQNSVVDTVVDTALHAAYASSVAREHARTLGICSRHADEESIGPRCKAGFVGICNRI